MKALETLQEISNHFEITYTNFKDHGRQIWVVKTIPASVTGTGDTLAEAVQDLFVRREMEEFRTAVQKASIGNKSVEEWKDKLRDLTGL